MFHRKVLAALAVLGATAVLGACSSRSVGSGPVDPGQECTVQSYAFDIHYLNNELVYLEPMPLEASGSWVYYTATGTGGSNSPDDAEIYAVNTDTAGRCCMEPCSPPSSQPLRAPYRPIA